METTTDSDVWSTYHRLLRTARETHASMLEKTGEDHPEYGVITMIVATAPEDEGIAEHPLALMTSLLMNAARANLLDQATPRIHHFVARLLAEALTGEPLVSTDA